MQKGSGEVCEAGELTIDERNVLINQSTFKNETSLLLGDVGVEKDKDDGTHSEEEILLPLVILFRGLFIQLLCVVPVGIWWISGIRGFLLALGQNNVISDLTAVCSDR